MAKRRVFIFVIVCGVLTGLCFLYSSSGLLPDSEYFTRMDTFHAPPPADANPPTSPLTPTPPSHFEPPDEDLPYMDPGLEKITTEPKVFKDVYVNNTLEDGTKLKIILYWNEVYGNKHFGLGFGRQPFLEAGCRINTCLTTGNRTRYPLDQVDAVLWHFRSNDKTLPKKRSPHTRYIFWMMESASYLYGDLAHFNGVFNWTFTYRRDSDIYNPYGRVYRRRQPLPVPAEPRDYAKGKSKMVAWFVSHCSTKSGREILAKALNKLIPVDTYGQCGNLKCDRSKHNKCMEMLNRDYKFYLSFENSLCKDYLTEKFFDMLRVDILPVVWGSGPYQEIAPPHSFVDANAFPTVHALAEHLRYLDKNDTAYNEYFRWKPYYHQPFYWARKAKSFCDLCEKLHNDEPPKSYNLKQWFERDSQCKSRLSRDFKKFINP